MYTLYKFHFLNGISEINQLYDILIIWPAPVCVYIYIYVNVINGKKNICLILIRIFCVSVFMEQAWSPATASRVQSARRVCSCCSMTTALASFGWSSSPLVCTVVWPTSCATLRPPAWSASRPCSATCSHGHPDRNLTLPFSSCPWSSGITLCTVRDLPADTHTYALARIHTGVFKPHARAVVLY